MGYLVHLVLVIMVGIQTVTSQETVLIVCENELELIDCGNNGRVNITSAVFGRSDGTTCPHSSILNTACGVDVSGAIGTLCDAQSQCEVTASSSLGGDPCLNTFKYLNITYTCEDSCFISIPNSDYEEAQSVSNGTTANVTCNTGYSTDLFTYSDMSEVTCDNGTLSPATLPVCYEIPVLIVCEQDSRNISCGNGGRVNITSAVFGRSDSTTCPHSSISNTACGVDVSGAIGTLCDAQSQCEVTASSSLGGDPCLNTFKYLNVTYTCEDFDECTANEHTCDENASCENTIGSYLCICNTNYSGDGFTCYENCFVVSIPFSDYSSGGREVIHDMKFNVTCDLGYSTGASQFTELNCYNGTVSPASLPICYANCNVDPVPFSDYENGDEVDHATNFTVTCNNGYSTGLASYNITELSCDNGTISSALPTCYANCNVDPVPFSDYENGDEVDHGMNFTVTCNNGYSTGLASYNITELSCDNGTLSSALPSCQDSCNVQAIPFSDLSEGRAIDHGTAFNITCIPGFSTGVSTFTEHICDNGTLSPTLPTCYKNCIVAVPFSDYAPNVSVYHEEIFNVTCSSGYSTGVSLFTELSCNNGTLSSAVLPTCYENCEVSIPFSDHVAKEAGHATTFIVTCNSGYSMGMNTSTEMSCNDGILSLDPLPTCYENCDVPSIQFSDYSSGGDVDHNATFIVTCNQGYSTGVSVFTELSCYDGTLSSAPPTCYENCEIPSIPNSNYSSGGDVQHSATITVTCNQGYSTGVSRFTDLTCDDGTFSPSPPTCYENCMVTVPLSDYSANVPVDHGERFNVTCNPGYSFDSASYLELSCDNSILSPDPLSSCNDIDECTLDSSLCTNGRCFNLIGNYTCICNSGFVLTDLHSCTALSNVSNVATSTVSVILEGAKLNGETLVYSAQLTNRSSALFIELELQYCAVLINFVKDTLSFTMDPSCITTAFTPGSVIGDMELEVPADNQDTADQLALSIGELSSNITRVLTANGLTLEGTFLSSTVQCDQSNCQNGGTCTTTGQLCDCPTGFYGDLCQNNIDDCTPASCANNGFCVDGDNSFTCVCSHGFTGDTCTSSICGSIACENGGVCSSSDQCTCAAGYIGSTCETNINECSPEPCRNGGTCIDGINSYTCSCRRGYTGTICDLDVDECGQDSSLCANGRCVNTLVGLHTCVCNSGHTLTNSDSCTALSDTLFTSSLRVELTGQTLDGVLLIYTNSLANRLSDEFMEYDTTFCFLFSEYVRASLQSRRYQLLGDSCEVIEFRQGSIIADISFQVAAATQRIADDLALAVADLSTDIPQRLSTNGQTLLTFFTANVQCDQSNCRNGGTCTNAAQHCDCPSGFSGAFCQNVSSSRGLSLAAIIGIVAGITAFVFVIISGVCCISLRNRQRSQAKQIMMADGYNDYPGFYGKKALDSYSDYGSYDGRRQAIDRMRVNGESVQWNPRLAEDRRHFSTPYVVDGRYPERRVDRKAIVY